MPVYIDILRACVPNPQWRWTESCHLYADTLDELHAFAARLGMKRAWFQHKPGRLPHYDLTATRRRQAVRLGAIEDEDDEVLCRMLRELRVARNENRIQTPRASDL